MKIEFNNRARVKSTRNKTPDGYLDVTAVIYRSGNFEFSTKEAPFSGMSLSNDILKRGKVIINVPRSAIEDRTFLESAALKPITEGHPKDFVNSKTNRYLSLGTSKSAARVENQRGDAEALTDLRITDFDLVRRVENDEIREVSIGNSGTLDMTPGLLGTERFDGVLGSILVNHIAIVDKGRGGRGVRLLNNHKEEEEEEERELMKTVTRTINGMDVELNEADAKIVDLLLVKLKNQGVEIEALKTEVATKAAEKKTIEADLSKAKEALSIDNITKLVNERAKVIETAKKIKSDVNTEQSNMQIKIDVINAHDETWLDADASEGTVNSLFRVAASAAAAAGDSEEFGKDVTKVKNALGTKKKSIGDEIKEAQQKRREYQLANNKKYS